MADAELDEIVTQVVLYKISGLSDELRQAESKVLRLRGARDALIAHCRGVGIPVTELAKDAQVSRQSVYEAIRRSGACS
jgi:hypothetical protein